MPKVGKPRAFRGGRIQAPGVCSVSLSAPDGACPASPTPPPPPVALPAPPPPPPPPAPAPPPPFCFPSSLSNLGNKRAWLAVHAHLRATPHLPLVVHGPVGCGKTCGVRALLRAMHMSIVELDGAEPDDAEQLLTWVKRSRDVQTMRGPTAVFLDDFESFTQPMKVKLGAAFRQMATKTHLAPLVITCNQFRDPSLAALHDFSNVRLVAPSEHTCREWFDRNQLVLQRRDGVRVKCPAPPMTATTRDLRRWRHLLEYKIRFQGNNMHELDVELANPFEATRRLLLRRVSPDTWSRGAERRDVAVLREHIGSYVRDDVDALSCALDAFSACDHAASLEHATHVAALVAYQHSVATTVGALPPPPLQQQTVHESGVTTRPRTRAERVDLLA